ncbi:alpha/beta hydrolase [Streptacidiphilus sp. ASG 303]|uniref:alpha/beta fold hydrolase n=1 Tax=Streptacidiphilus sp. ASG 303 TaxID=2896847 RepID=UPI001E4FBABB|nr:alpha/beta hydrolase [Streptacidiphilus sp. ASG 303]MCD0485641.1 alpha/beta hydrolase [Streptacidiphilus sp. ASG 303]
MTPTPATGPIPAPHPAVPHQADPHRTGPVPGHPLRTVAVPGCTLAVSAVEPDADGLPPAVMVHGLGGSTQNWAELMAELAGDVHAEAVDLPGFGHSAPPDDGDLSLSGHVRAVTAYLESADRGPVHLFGNSLGGAVAVRLAALRPDLVRTLTLVSPALPELPPQHTALPTGLLAVPGAARLLERLAAGQSAEQRTAALFALVYGDPELIPQDRRDLAVREYRRRMDLPYAMDVLARSARGIVRAYAERGAQSLWRQAGQVQAPVLLVYGLRDRLVSYRSARRACEAFPDARLLVLPDSGHVAMMEHPVQVARAFRELAAEAAARGGRPVPAEGRRVVRKA